VSSPKSSHIQILSAGAVSPGLTKVVANFRRQSGIDVNVVFATAPEIRRKLGGTERADIVIAPLELLDELRNAGKATNAFVTLGRIGIGVIVRRGAPSPKITTADEFKQSLLNAEAIIYNRASTGVYLEKLFDRLGVSALIESKTTRYDDFAAVRDHISNGPRAEIGFGATTVIMENRDKGIDYVGPLPKELQNYTTYSVTAIKQSNANDTVNEFLAYIDSPAAKMVFLAAGIE
jgi:molybdate transport system substrate-binding protein